MENKPILILDVSKSFFSIARHSGRIRISGSVYVYCPMKDALVREDWLKVYQRLSWTDFLEAVKTGKKPDLKKKHKNPTQNNNELITPSLFD